MEHPISGMCSPPDAVPLLQFMLRAINAKKVVECGVFSGQVPAAGITCSTWRNWQHFSVVPDMSQALLLVYRLHSARHGPGAS